MTHILRVDDPRELLALVPYQLGFQPESSVVTISLRGVRRQVGVMARSDLRDLCGPEGERVAAAIMRCLHGDGASGVVVVVYDDHPAASDDLRASIILDRLRRAAWGTVTWVALWWLSAKRCQVAILRQGQAGAVQWEDDGLTPMDLDSTQVSATMVLNGVAVRAHRSEIVELADVDPIRFRRAASSADRWWRRRSEATTATVGPGEESPGASARPGALSAWQIQSSALWLAALDDAGSRQDDPDHAHAEPGAPSLGRMSASLRDPAVRDRVLAAMIVGAVRGGSCAHQGAQDSRNDGRPWELAWGSVMDVGRARAPQSAALHVLSELVLSVAAHTRHKHRADALALVAFLAWWDGAGARARVLCELAARSDPQHRLTQLVAELLDAGIAPGWVRRHARTVAE